MGVDAATGAAPDGSGSSQSAAAAKGGAATDAASGGYLKRLIDAPAGSPSSRVNWPKPPAVSAHGSEHARLGVTAAIFEELLIRSGHRDFMIEPELGGGSERA